MNKLEKVVGCLLGPIAVCRKAVTILSINLCALDRRLGGYKKDLDTVKKKKYSFFCRESVT
jgi:hypothetical protein